MNSVSHSQINLGDSRNSDEDWIDTLLKSEFFGICMNHKYHRKNEKNCIDCNVEICRHCCNTEAHLLHRCLQICKYVYQDVLRLLDIQHYFDCSEIQREYMEKTYKINGEKAIHLNSRPQAKDAKPSTKSKNGASCVTCKRYIQDRPNRFCSISCKVLMTNEGIHLMQSSMKIFVHQCVGFCLEHQDKLPSIVSLLGEHL